MKKFTMVCVLLFSSVTSADPPDGKWTARDRRFIKDYQTSCGRAARRELAKIASKPVEIDGIKINWGGFKGEWRRREGDREVYVSAFWKSEPRGDRYRAISYEIDLLWIEQTMHVWFLRTEQDQEFPIEPTDDDRVICGDWIGGVLF